MGVKVRGVFLFLVYLFAGGALQAQRLAVDSVADGREMGDTELRTVTVQGRQGGFSGMYSGKIVMRPEGVRFPAMLGNVDVLKMLALTPGVQNAGDANTNMYIRGGDAGQELLLYNRVPVYSPGHLFGFFPLFNADHLSSLEMKTGHIEPTFGGRLSSVIDVSGRTEMPTALSVQGSVGVVSSQATLSIPLSRKFAAYVSGRQTYLSLLLKPLLNQTVNKKSAQSSQVENAKYDFRDGNITLLGELSERHKVAAHFFVSHDGMDMSEEEILLNGDLRWSNRVASLEWNFLPSAGKRLTQSAYTSRYENRLYSSQALMSIDLASFIETFGYKAVYAFPAHGLSWQAGVQYDYHVGQPQRRTMDNLTLSLNSHVPEYSAQDAAIFLSAQMDVSPRLSAVAGMRYALFASGDKTFTDTEPRLSLRYQVYDNQYLRAAFARQTQYLHLLSSSSIGMPVNFWLASSSSVRPQWGNAYSLGYYRMYPRSGYEFSADVFLRNMWGLNEYNFSVLTSTSESDIGSMLHFGSGLAYGLELMLKKNWGQWSGWLSYTLARSERTFADINQGATFPARYDRRHDLSLAVNYTLNAKWDFSLVQVYTSGGAYTQPSSWYFINNTPVKQYGEYNGARMPNYNRTDISINYWFRRDNGLNFSVFNLFAVQNPVYVFLNVERDKMEEGLLKMSWKRKTLTTIIPSVSWRFKF